MVEDGVTDDSVAWSEDAAARAEVVDRVVAALREIAQGEGELPDALRPAEAAQLVSVYLLHVPLLELSRTSVAALAAAIHAHVVLSTSARDGRPVFAVHHSGPGRAWPRSGSVAVQVVCDDGPFLVDTISLTLTRLGWDIHDLYHPQVVVGTSAQGERSFSSAVLADDATPGRESWVSVEASLPAGERAHDGAQVQEAAQVLLATLRHALDDLRVAVDDFDAMTRRLLEVADQVRQGPHPDGEDPDEVAMLLEWLSQGHLVVMGTRQHALVEDSPGDPSGEGQRHFDVVTGTGLGILREDREPVSGFEAVPPAGLASLLLVTKDDARSTVRRSGHLDHFSVRIFDDQRRCVGEHRVLGLLASAAYTEQVERIPLLRTKAAQVLRWAGYPEGSHGAKAVLSTIGTYPRDELFQAPVEQLAPVVTQLSELRERREVRSFPRWGTRRRFLHVLVSLPRDRYTTESRRAMERAIGARVPVESIDFFTQFSASVLCRVFFTVKVGPGLSRPELDAEELQEALAAAVRTWQDDFDHLAHEFDEPITVDFSEGYREATTPRQAVWDLRQLRHLHDENDMQLAMYPAPPDHAARWRMKVMRPGDPITLSQVMPHFTSLGLQVVDENPHDLRVDGRPVAIYDFGLDPPSGTAWDAADRSRILAAFEAVHRGRVDADPLNELVTTAGLNWRQVHLLRGLSRYLLQAQSLHSQAYIAQTLLALPELARSVVELMEAKFDPERHDAPAQGGGFGARAAAVEAAREHVRAGLKAVSTLDHDRIISQLVGVVDACVRTNHYQCGAQALALKLLPGKLDFLPEPRPAFEIFVHSPTVEGVHLRFGTVARGGLRWSDRAEDFRTEVLGLVKAQMVKNTVIIPVGAKGGFLPRHLPDPATDRKAWLAAGQACYRVFIGSLLDLTDNLVDGVVVPPERTVRHDGDDTYLVVAADKGTAGFSDLANAIAVERGFWLGDAFASGGSHGYDHKAMGITARGAWQSVTRHFAEQGIDVQRTDFTCVGIGDMSGDVFGNGMLLSPHIRLVAAFNHQHVFLDPTPDARTSFAERQRLFAMPRSTWADYDTSLISEGGGVHDRAAKAITIGDPARRALGIESGATSMTGTELVRCVLRAPVDLLWNGGVGTYVKASTQSHAEVGDRTNDHVRVDAAQLRCRSVGEGGNLGLTQPARVEFAQSGGRINTDFIDNSAGVDTSDHEVNIKILLDRAIAAGRITAEERNELLPTMVDEVAALVLRHNVDQNVALANALARASDMAGVHEDLMQRLEGRSQFDRVVEDMPDTSAMQARIAAGAGLTTPELATLMAWTKIDLADQVLASDLPDDPYLADRLTSYFPATLRDRFADLMVEHPLRREIITTVAVNRFVNSQGISAAHRLTEELGVGVADVIRAQLAARTIHSAAGIEVAVARTGVHPDLQRHLRLAVRRLVDRGTRWILHNLPKPLDVQATIERYRAGVSTVQHNLAQVLTPTARDAYLDRLDRHLRAGVDEELAILAAGAGEAHLALAMVTVAEETGRELLLVSATQVALQARTGMDDLLTRVEELPREDRWQARARSALRSELLELSSRLTARALALAPPDAARASTVVDTWWGSAPSVSERVGLVHEAVEASSAAQGLAPLQVALQSLRDLAGDPAGQGGRP